MPRRVRPHRAATGGGKIRVGGKPDANLLTNTNTSIKGKHSIISGLILLYTLLFPRYKGAKVTK